MAVDILLIFQGLGCDNMDNSIKSILVPPMDPCPWCGTTEGYFQKIDILPDHIFKYRYLHDISICPVRIYTIWHEKKTRLYKGLE